MCVYCVYLLCIYKYTHMYLRKICYVYILNIYIYHLYEYKYIHANTCNYFQNICCMCVSYIYIYIYIYIYTHIIYTEHTHILCEQKLLF